MSEPQDILESGESIPEKTPPIENVGEEFIKWAEKCWALDTLLSREVGENMESCPYTYIRQVFVNKINELVEEKIKL
jgi:hypothetical protein